MCIIAVPYNGSLVGVNRHEGIVGGGLDFVRKVGIFLSFILTLFLLSQRQIWEKFLRTIELLCPRPGSPGQNAYHKLLGVLALDQPRRKNPRSADGDPRRHSTDSP